MITFTTALVLLVLGYAVYGAFVERVFGADASRKTPCYTMADGVDYTPMPTWKVYIIPEFDLQVFQSPSGRDFQRVLPAASEEKGA